MMSWLSFVCRLILGVVAILTILWWAETLVPFGSVLVLIVLVGITGVGCFLNIARYNKRVSGTLD